MEILEHFFLGFLLLLAQAYSGDAQAGYGNYGPFSRVYGLHRINRSTPALPIDYGLNALNRSSFPKGFIFGAASAAYQVEGAWNTDGKGESIWDHFTHKYPWKIQDRSNGDVAIDSYHKYEKDIKLLKNMNADSYRFSISWPRIIPHGKISKGINEKGIEYYNKLINEVLANGLIPIVTMYHWDIPQALVDEYGGFLSPKIRKDFYDYANLCFERFGDRVKHWITFNEPWATSISGYATGIFAPGRCSAWMNANCTGGDSGTEPYFVTHHQLLAHADTVKLLRTKYKKQKGVIGITLISTWMEPLTNSALDKRASVRALDFMLGWFLNPVVYGSYPATMRLLVGKRLPKFTREDSRLLKGSYDFIGINYYTTFYASHISSPPNKVNLSATTDPNVNQTFTDINGNLIGEQAGSSWLHVYPKGIWQLLVYIKNRYRNPIIYITENGVDEVNNPKLSLEAALKDNFRIRYYFKHLAFVLKAIKNGVRVRAYYGWSILDNFEWSSGYTVRFGINYVDYKTLRRYPKLSAGWFRMFLRK